MRSDALFLDDMYAAAEALLRFTAARQLDEVATDEVLSAAILQKFTVIGEAAKKVSEALRARYPDVAWSRAVAMRNVVVHAYFGVDWSVIWSTIEDDIPELRDRIRLILDTEFNGPSG